MARISGNDVASYQKDIDFDTYKKNSNFILMKVSEGVGFIDPKFKQNQSGARRVDMARGYYHFARPDLGNAPEAEAQYFLDQIGGLQDGEILALDYEVNNRIQSHVDWCKKWLDYVFNKTGCRPLIYMSESVTTQLDWTAVVAGSYGLWLAKYLNNPTPDATYVTGKWSFAAMYQWTSKQSVPGIPTVTDGDVFYGDISTFKKYGYKTPTPPPPPVDYQDLYKKEVAKNDQLSHDLNQANTQIASLQTKIDNAKRDLA